MRTHYDNLQVARNASPEVIRGAYKHLSQRWHPDKNPTDRERAEKILRVINRAYEVLSDPVLRKKHDEWIAQQEQVGKPHAPNAQKEEAGHETPAEGTKIAGEGVAYTLWNPNAAANWCLLFTPIFGAWLHSLNWAALGEGVKANHSRIWAMFGVIFIPSTIFLDENVARGVGFWYLILWYFVSARPQVKYVKSKLDGNYVKRGWTKPIGVALLAAVTFLGVGGYVVSITDPEILSEQALADISGVWKVRDDKTLVTLRLEEIPPFILIDKDKMEVSIEKFDSDNHVLTIFIDKGRSKVWAIRQVFDESGRFTLLLTLDDGGQIDLDFVRRL